MGKAGRWIRSFLLGKKDEKHKKIDRFLLPADTVKTIRVLSGGAPQEKRRWSFKKSSMDVATHHHHHLKRNGSFDASFTRSTLLVKQALQDSDIERIRALVSGKTTSNGATETTLAPGKKPSSIRHREDAAATKIQAIFRSYLARKALRALKGLVKIQALVRGHLVRIQTAAMIKRMQALMTIQIRARVQRAQFAEFGFRSRSSYIEEKSLETSEPPPPRGVSRSRSRLTDDEFRFREIDSGRRRSVSNGQPTNSTKYQRQSPEFFKVSPKTHHPNDSKLHNSKQTKGPFILSYIESSSYSFLDSHFLPTYMSNTESSRAKARSRSEPKQRPRWSTKQTSRQSTVSDLMEEETRQPWSMKLYQ